MNYTKSTKYIELNTGILPLQCIALNAENIANEGTLYETWYNSAASSYNITVYRFIYTYTEYFNIEPFQSSKIKFDLQKVIYIDYGDNAKYTTFYIYYVKDPV